jgi:hypothetical protein
LARRVTPNKNPALAGLSCNRGEFETATFGLETDPLDRLDYVERVLAALEPNAAGAGYD